MNTVRTLAVAMAAAATLGVSARYVAATRKAPETRISQPVARESRSVTPAPAPAFRPAAAPAATSLTEVFKMHPTEQEFAQCTIVDANADGSTFEYYYAENNGNVFDWPIYYVNNNTNLDADDWIFTPAIALGQTDCLYEVAIDVRSGATGMPEAFEVAVATAPNPAAVLSTAIDESSVLNLEFETYTGRFGVPSTGNYYVGIHCKSPKSRSWRIMMRDLRVSLTDATALAPAAPSVLDVVPDQKGGLAASVTFRFPELSVNGRKLDSSTLLTVKAESPAETLTLTGKPGEEKSAVIKAVNGRNVITLTSSSAAGTGGMVKAEVTCGFDMPTDPVVTKSVAADNLSCLISWEPITVGANGGFVDPDHVTYNVYEYAIVGEDDEQTAMWIIHTTGLTKPEFSFSVKADAIQQSYDFMVTAANSAGETDGSELSYATVQLGRPYALPMTEDFTEGNVNYSGYTVEETPTADMVSWGFNAASAIDESAGLIGALIGYSTSTTQATQGRISLPRFSAVGMEDLQVALTLWLAPATAPTQVRLATPDGMHDALLGTVSFASGSGWTTLPFAVPAEFNGAKAVYVYFLSDFPTAAYHFILSGFDVRQVLAHDLELSSLAVGSPVHGVPAKVTAKVSNVGAKSAVLRSLKASVTSGGKEVATVDFGSLAAAEIAPGKNLEIEGTFEIKEFDWVNRTMIVSGTIEVDADENPANNKAATGFCLRGSEAPVVSDLMGEWSEQGVSLSWTNPLEGARAESFEHLAHGDCSADLDGWVNIDFDRLEVYGVEEVNYPLAGYPKGFQAISVTELASTSPTFAAHSGDRYLIAFSAMEAQSDDWLISPELIGADGISFWLNTLSSVYPETVEIMASSTDRDMDSFTVVRTITKSTSGWEQFTIDLPAATRYVAFHYVSNDQFGLLLDDVTYTPAPTATVFSHFVVYRDGVEIAQTATGTHFDANTDAFHATYNVAVATTTDGVTTVHPLSNSYCAYVAGIEDINADPTETKLYDLLGRRVYGTPARGIYTIRAQQ